MYAMRDCMQSIKYLTFAFKIVVKKRKLNSELAEVICVLGEMEKDAEERAEERDLKRRKLEWEMEEKRRETERKHEERMQLMFMNFMREMSMGRPPWTPRSYPSHGQSSLSNYMHNSYNPTMDNDLNDPPS